MTRKEIQTSVDSVLSLLLPWAVETYIVGAYQAFQSRTIMTMFIDIFIQNGVQ